MRNKTAFGVSSNSVRFGPQFEFLNLILWLILIINACNCRKIQQEPSAAGIRQPQRGVQLPLGHIGGSRSPHRAANSSRESALLQSLERDRFRLQTIRWRMFRNVSAVDAARSVSIPVRHGQGFGTGAYVTTLGFGTPKTDHLMGIDTGSDITWIQCEPCSECSPQPGPVFDPQRSSYKTIPCQSDTCEQLRYAAVFERGCLVGENCFYGLRYEDGTTSIGELGTEKLRVASDVVYNFAFGCGHNNRGFDGLAGILGLGRGALSFPYQTTKRYRGRFSYCPPDINNVEATGSLSFGASAIPSSGVFTKLLTNPSERSYYYVGLSGIGVKGSLLPLPSRVFNPSEGGAWTVVDSGTVFSRLSATIYDALRDLYVSKTPHIARAEAWSLFDTCYYVPYRSRPVFPDVTLIFQDGAKVTLHGAGVLLPVDNQATHVCLAFGRWDANANVIGSFQQQHFRVSYDIINEKLGFTDEPCGS